MEHKHRGFERLNGSLRIHPVEQVHKDKQVQKWHNDVVKKTTAPVSKPKTKTPVKDLRHFFKKAKKNSITLQLDNDGYISIDMSSLKQKGVRISSVTPGKVYFAKDASIKGVQFDK